MDFEKMWQAEAKGKEIDDPQKFWDLRAEEFNELGKKPQNDIVDYLKQKGVIFEGAKVLDIGCGAGRHSTAFLEYGAQVTGIDISPSMIEFAKENAQAFDTALSSFKVLPWAEANLADEGWENEFDLVFASMSPAINEPQALKKMIKASKNYCFMSSHLQKRDALGEQLRSALNLEADQNKQRNTLYYAFNMLWELGYLAEFHHQDHDELRMRPIEKAQNYYERILKVEDEKTKTRIYDYLVKNAEKGMLEDRYQSKTGFLLWSVGKD